MALPLIWVLGTVAAGLATGTAAQNTANEVARRKLDTPPSSSDPQWGPRAQDQIDRFTPTRH